MHHEGNSEFFGTYKYLEYRINTTQSENETVSYCLSFAYHMFGSDVRSFRVGYRSLNGVVFWIFQQSGNKGDIWQQAVRTFNFRGSFNVSNSCEIRRFLKEEFFSACYSRFIHDI